MRYFEDTGIRLLEKDDVVAIHALVMQEFGDQPGGPKEGCVESAVGAAYNASLYEGTPEEPNLLVLVASLMFSLLFNHCFIDGNKRVTWSAMAIQLQLLDLEIRASNYEAEALVMNVIQKRIGKPGLIDWLAERVEPAAA